jgi:hypothetical protein
MDTSWGVTTQNVLDLTGVTVTAGHVSIAGGIVEIYANRTQAASGSLRARDFSWIVRAVTYQAAWVADNVGLMSRDLTADLTQDGVRTRSYDGTTGMREWAVTLAPLAARCIKNLSWKGRRQEPMGERVRLRWGSGPDGDPFFLGPCDSW